MTTLHTNPVQRYTGVEEDPGAGAARLHLHAPAPPGFPTDVPGAARDRGDRVRVTLACTPSGQRVPASMLVVGGSGGAGASTTAWGLACALVDDSVDEVWPVLTDATPAGGDVALRAPDQHRCLATVQAWLTGSEPATPAALADACGYTGTGVGVLARGEGGLPRRETFAGVHRRLLDAGAVPVYDGGTPVAAPGIRPLLADSRIPVVVAVAARADAANRLLHALRWLETECGEYTVADVAIAVTHQSVHAHRGVATHLRTHLGGWVRTVADIPYDPHLALGQTLRWSRLGEATRTAYRTLLTEVQK